jgi:hypothetical protein
MKWSWSNFAFIPEEEPRTPIVLKIPADKVQEILRLRDNYGRIPRNEDSEAHYLLWKAIAEIYPCVRVGSWKITFPSILTIEVVENLDK